MKRRNFLLWLLHTFFYAGYTASTPQKLSAQKHLNPTLLTGAARYPDTRFQVISDPHFYDTALGDSGEAFEAYINRDRKLLTLSGEILETAVADMAETASDFVLVTGDLTKDGEEICHRGAAQRLRPLLDAGKQVIVVPGNHDISNPESLRYTPGGTRPEPGVSPDQFKEIYQDFGYGNALFQDPNSLSYVAEPVQGLWILALDSNRYTDNRPGHHPIVGGALSRKTLAWAEAGLSRAKTLNKGVIAVLHHGIMEHYPANESFYTQYLVKDYEKVSRLLARYRVRLAFTGHFHAQDITSTEVELDNGRIHRIFDIETGSLVTSPCPIRTVEISGGRAQVASRFVTAIPSMGQAFKAHAETYVFNGTVRLADAKLAKFKVPETERGKINRQIARAYAAHLKGDEIRPDMVIDPEGFGLWLRFIAWYQKDLLEGWYTDLSPADNDLVIELATGNTLPV